MSKKQNPLDIRTGDTVCICFNHTLHPKEFTAKVIAVVDRTLMGNDSCIEYIPDESGRDIKAEEMGIPYGCSVSHVKKVLQRAPYVVTKGTLSENIFRDELEALRELSHDRWPGYYKVGGVRVCYPSMEKLVTLVLAHAQGTLNRPLDMDKFHELWEKSKFLGKVEVPTRDDFNEDSWMTDHYTAVNWKVFKKFVLNNKEKILFTRKEMIQAGIEFHKAMWKDAWEDDFDLDEDNEHSDEEEVFDYADS